MVAVPSPRAALGAAVALAVLCGCSGDGGRDVAAPVRCPGGLRVPEAAPSATPRPPGPPARPVGGAGEGLDLVALLPRTGQLAFLGAATVAAAELAVDDVDAAGGVLGQPVRLVHADSAEGVAGAAEAAVAEHLAAGADAVVGPLSSSVAAAVLPEVAASDAVLITPGAAASGLDTVDGGGRLFRTAATEALQGRALAGLVLEDGVRDVGLVLRADDHGRAVAGAFSEVFEAGGGRIAHRVERDPASTEVDLGPLAGDGLDAAVLVGLADTAPVIDALVAAGRGPRHRLTYGTDGNLGDRLADLVSEPSMLACMRGLLAVAPVPDRLRERLEDRLGIDASAADLSHAAETYDTVIAVAVAAEAAGSDETGATTTALVDVTRGGQRCESPARCLALARSGDDLALVGTTGPLPLDEAGNRQQAMLTFAAFDRSGRLARLSGRPVG